MTTGTIIFLTLIAALVLVLGVVVIWQCCNIRNLINESENKSRNNIYRTYDSLRYQLVKYIDELKKDLSPDSENASKSGLNLESATPNGTITPPSSFSDIELRKYCIEQTRKDQVYLRIEDAQRLYEYILNGRQERKEESNGEF
ncbi:hypothetical protein O1504_19155 [Bacteroides fragilis]|uniref:hypothetical protein n=1 Tax=Bacteroides fragilis TaxID=817 RepID=UPI002164A04D|nr:hypothetical protein [Bacteroides fragilis]MCZ2591926.1 hypothetical protein [Bacteroides fragilis]UVP36835.1 hypothetical protein NXV17_15605 [Bacteroides fragilis]